MIFFNSSMPRSGSTLLQNILAQNPDIHATPTDGFLELIYGARVNFTNCNEFKAQDSEQMTKAWRGFCREGLNGYVIGLSDKKHTCIKSRGIGTNYNWFESFLGEPPKIICMVREIKSILSSMEKIYRSNSEYAQEVCNPSEMKGLTVNSRVEQWLTSAPVGLSLKNFENMKQLNISNRCLFVRYEDLTFNPSAEMKSIYNYLGIEEFTHDFNNVEQKTKEDDSFHSLNLNLHTIRNNVKFDESDHKEVLGDNLCKWIDNICVGYQKDYGYI